MMDEERVALPRFAVQAIAGGPPWRAIVLGLSGESPARLLSEGERIGDFVVVRIVTDTIVVRGLDTTLVLTMPRSTP